MKPKLLVVELWGLGDLVIATPFLQAAFARAVRRMIAYEQPDNGTLVLAAGVPESWVREVPGVR